VGVVDGTPVEHLDQQLDVVLLEEPEAGGVAGELGSRRAPVLAGNAVEPVDRNAKAVVGQAGRTGNGVGGAGGLEQSAIEGEELAADVLSVTGEQDAVAVRRRFGGVSARGADGQVDDRTGLGVELRRLPQLASALRGRRGEQ
jgi:hypothetical protein